MSELHWFDLFESRLSRRDMLRVSRDVAGLLALGNLPSCSFDRAPRFRSDPFTLGVASGDPAADGVVLWTRLDGLALAEVDAAAKRVPVKWEVAEDEGLARIVKSGSALATPEMGHSIHAEADGLRPGASYWYRFTTGGMESAVGRTRTAPADDATPERMRFAFVSCQNYEHGFYTAYRHISEEDLDFVVHLGDYIYEKRFNGPTVRENESGEVFTLDEYRGRYATIRGDADLRAAHQAFPWIMTTDDHEVVNDYANDVAPGNESPEKLLLRRAAAYQAYYEFMPLRRSSMPNGPDLPLHRRLPYGKLARLHVLDTRQYRTPQPCGAGQKPRCEGATAPTGTMMGSAQEAWLADGLRASDARWDILANQVLIAQLARDEGEATTYSMDKWDGYAGARGRLLSLLAEIEPNNTVAITGDIHSSWVADIKRDFDDPASRTIATELVGTSISSGGDGRDSFPGFDALQARNPHIRFYDGRRGYVRNTVTPGSWTADYRIVPYVERPGAPVETRASFLIEAASPGAHRADA